MLQLLKRFSWVGLLALGIQSSWGFSLIGPNPAYPGASALDPWQVPGLGYNLMNPTWLYLDPLLIGPKNIGEEYRRNTPVLYYTYDANFLDYFGSNGTFAVDQAMSILNSLMNVSQYSGDLSEFPLSTIRENYAAEALFIYDLKSWTLHLMLEQLGLTDPERYVWGLHDRYQLPNTTCPAGMEYLVVKRNFDPTVTPLSQYLPSGYVNGTLYSYVIIETCKTDPEPEAVALPFPVDPLAFTGTAVAGSLVSGLSYGMFYTGLTRDDVGGLRYLLRTNNVNFESAGPGTSTSTVTFTTNNTHQLLYTSNLTVLAAQALTNDAPTLEALYPGLVTTATVFYASVTVTNVTAYYTNYPWSSGGSPASLAYATTVTSSMATYYQHTFANVVTNSYFTNGVVTIQQTTIGSGSCIGWYPAGSICTNTTTVTVSTNILMGDYYIIPTNACGFTIIKTWQTNVVATTNLIQQANNTLTGNSSFQAFSESIVTYSTNHVFEMVPNVCATTNIVQGSVQGLFQGIEKVTFVRRDYDSLLGRYFNPITNTYVLNSITNNTLLPQTIQRTVTAPDILFSATDMANGPSGTPTVNVYSRNVNFNMSNIGAGLAGPGTIETPTTVAFEKVGLIYLNASSSPNFLSAPELDQIPGFIYGSFDGTTNAPVVYPDGTSIQNLENQVLMQISVTDTNGNPLPTSVFTGNVFTITNNVSFSFKFQASGGTPPYTWSLASGSASLPPSLGTYTSSCACWQIPPSGIVSGTPTQTGTFDFTVQMTDAGGRSVDLDYAIIINNP